MSTVASPGRLLAYIGAPPQPFIQRPALAGGFIQRLLAVPTPCRPLERAVPVPCQRASIAAQARARGRAVLGTSTGEAGPGCFRTGPNQHCARAGPMGQARLENFNHGYPYQADEKALGRNRRSRPWLSAALDLQIP